MKIISHSLLACGISMLTTLVFADGYEPPLDHYAKGFRLQTDGNFAIYRLPLDNDIYKTTVRSDLGDIRVFNNNGEIVPHAIHKMAPVESHESIQLSLPFFPFRQDTNNQSALPSDIFIAENGRITYIQGRGSAVPTENSDSNSYLIDLSSVQQSIDELEFEFAGEEINYVKKASLSYSDNLNDWHMYTNITLVRLLYSGHTLVKNRVPAPKIKAKYIRFDWYDNSSVLRLNAVHALLNSSKYNQNRLWSQINGIRSEKDDHIIKYDTSGQFPIDRIELVMPVNNTLIEATLSSRRNEKGIWTQRYSGLFYNLRVQNLVLQSETVAMSLITDRYWQLQIKTLEGLGSLIPQLKFGWIPDELYFLARGPEPYTLAFGNGQIGTPNKPIDALTQVLNNNQTDMLVGQAQTAGAILLMGESALKPELEVPWQRLVLWTILIVGVLVTSFMAYRLIKQINLAG